MERCLPAGQGIAGGCEKVGKLYCEQTRWCVAVHMVRVT